MEYSPILTPFHPVSTRFNHPQLQVVFFASSMECLGPELEVKQTFADQTNGTRRVMPLWMGQRWDICMYIYMVGSMYVTVLVP